MKSRSTLPAKITRRTVESLDKQIKALENKRHKAIEKLQTRCKHPVKQIVEAEYEHSSDYFGAQSPFRICMLCGYAEEGWGCGYWKLDTREEVLWISRKKAWDYVLKLYTQNELNEMRYHK